MKVTMSDCRQVKFCSRGVRLFFKKYNLDYKDFLKNGIEIKDLEQLNDSMANKVIEVRRGRK